MLLKMPPVLVRNSEAAGPATASSIFSMVRVVPLTFLITSNWLLMKTDRPGNTKFRAAWNTATTSVIVALRAGMLSNSGLITCEAPSMVILNDLPLPRAFHSDASRVLAFTAMYFAVALVNWPFVIVSGCR